MIKMQYQGAKQRIAKQRIENKELIQAIIEGAQEKKAHQIVHMDMSEIESASTGDFVICTGNSTQHVDAVADSIREYVEEKLGTRPYNYDGYQNSQWIVLDYGNVYVHVFLPEFRERYRLEELWADAVVTEIEDIY